MDAKRLYLVTGAAGHLGTALIAKLKENGCSVRALCRSGEKKPPAGVEIYYGDVCDKESLHGFFTNTDGADMIVIHCAGVVSIASKYVQRVHDVNVGGTKNIVDLSLQYGVKKLIYVSSVHAIPEKVRGEAMDEDCAFSPDAVTGLYAQTKAEATAYVFAAVEKGLDASVVFPSGIIGPYDRGRSHTNQVVEDYVAGRLTAAVLGGYDFVDVRDVADGIISCAENGASGEGYILSGGYHTIKELLDTLHELTGKKQIKTFLSVRFITFIAPLCELYYKMLHQPPLFTSYSMYTLSSNSSFSNAKAREKLNFKPRDIRATLNDTVKWMRSTGRLPE